MKNIKGCVSGYCQLASPQFLFLLHAKRFKVTRKGPKMCSNALFLFEWYINFFPSFDNLYFTQMDRAQYEAYESEADYDSMEQNPTESKVIIEIWIN